MTLSATQEPGVAEQVTFASASEMKLAGINWAFSPVADVNSDARNPVIGKRTICAIYHCMASNPVPPEKALDRSVMVRSPYVCL